MTSPDVKPLTTFLKFLATTEGTVVVSATIAIALIADAIRRQMIVHTWGAYLILLTALFCVNFTVFIRHMRNGDRPALESNWGGLGGGLGGWRLSVSGTFLLISAVLFALLVHGIGAASRPESPDLLERYRAAINLGQRQKIQFDKREIIEGKLRLTGTAPTKTALNAFWDQVKLANSTYDDIIVDLKIAAGTGESRPPANPPKPNVAPQNPAPNPNPPR